MSNKPIKIKTASKSNGTSKSSQKKNKSGEDEGQNRDFVLRPGARSLQEEIAANRSHNLNFKSTFDPTPPPVFPPPAFSEEGSLNPLATQSKPKHTLLDDPIDGFEIVNERLESPPGRELSFGGPSEGRKTASFFLEDKAVRGSQFSFYQPEEKEKLPIENQGMAKRQPRNLIPSPKPDMSPQMSISIPSKKTGQNKGSMAYRLFNVPREEMPKDALDEYIREERQRELDFYELNRRFNDNNNMADKYAHREEEIYGSGGIHSTRLNKYSEVEDLLQNRGVVDISDLVERLPIGRLSLAGNNTWSSAKGKFPVGMQREYYKPKMFGQHLAEGAVRLRDYDKSTEVNVFL